MLLQPCATQPAMYISTGILLLWASDRSNTLSVDSEVISRLWEPVPASCCQSLVVLFERP